ncbi:hypothetical protein V6O07_09890, partial [Arthrospira platensis SPKY2]
QKEIPDLSKFDLSEDQKKQLNEKAKHLVTQISENLDIKNELASLKMDLEQLELEYEHFKKTTEGQTFYPIAFKRNIKANRVLEFWLDIENLAEQKKKIGFIKKLIYRFK